MDSKCTVIIAKYLPINPQFIFSAAIIDHLVKSQNYQTLYLKDFALKTDMILGIITHDGQKFIDSNWRN